MRFDRRFLPYVVSIGSTAIALLLTLWLEPIVSPIISPLFYIAIIVSTWYGGFRPGMMTIVLSTIAIRYFFIFPPHQFRIEPPGDVLRLSIFLLVALVINLLTSHLLESKKKIAQLSQQVARENAEQLAMALSAAQMGIWNWNTVTGEIKWSPEHEQLFGLVPGTFDGRYETFEACVHPDDREEVTQTIQRALQDRRHYEQEFRVVWADGSIHWLEGRGRAFYDSAGRPVRMTGTIVNIDDEKQAEILLHQQYQQQRIVMEISQHIRRSLNLAEILQTTVEEVRQFLQVDRVIIFQFGRDWSGTVIVESVGAEWRAILSTQINDPCFNDRYVEPYKQGLVTAISDIYTEEIDACHLELLANFQVRANLVVPIVQGGELWGLLIAHHCAEPRSWQPSEIALMRQLATQAGIAIQQGTLVERLQIELGQRRETEAALRENERKFRQLAENIQEVFYLYTADYGELLYINGTYEVIWQRSAKTLYQNPLSFIDAIHPDDRDRVSDAFDLLLNGRADFQEEYRIIRPDGSIRWIYDRSSFVYDEAGEPYRVAGLATDITDRKQTEISLQQMNAQLEQRVAQRTAELTQVNALLQQELIQKEQLQQQLIQREKLLDSFFNAASAAHIGLSIHDRNLHYLKSNRALADINGCSIQTLLESTQPELLSQLGKKLMPLLNSVMETGQPISTEELSASNANQPELSRYWLVSCFPIFAQAQQPIAVGTILLEITDRKHSEQALQQANARLLEQTNKLELINQELQTTLETLQISEEELRNSHEQLETIALAAQLEQQRYQDLFNFAPDGYLVTDSNGVIQEANQAAGMLLGVNPPALVRKALSIYIAKQDRSLFRTHLNQCLSQLTYELTIQPHGGNSFPATVTLSTIRDGEDRPIGIRWLIKDMTERKQAQAKLQEAERRWRFLLENVQLAVVGLDLNGTLNYVNPFCLQITGYAESEVLGLNWFETFISPADRPQIQKIFSEILTSNAHTYYQNFIVTKSGEQRFIAWNNTLLRDLAGNAIGTIGIGEDITERRKIEQMKNEFLGIVSHELRTPLTAIRASLGLLQSGMYDNKPEKVKRLIEIAAIDSERLVRLVNDILDLERLESGRAILEKTTCKAADLMQQAVNAVQGIALPQNITLSIHPTDVEVWAASDAIVQVLTNLLTNGIKFSPPDTTITLQARRQNGLVLFQVSDRGRGIPADKLEAIFGRFQQVDASDSRDKGGTGLGLAICRSIIDRHGGRIWAESTLGIGSTFNFTLPLPSKQNNEL
ncbi:MAG TPA: PAS domain S-box protein [Leptolyngbyaceae cyanobacterium]